MTFLNGLPYNSIWQVMKAGLLNLTVPPSVSPGHFQLKSSQLWVLNRTPTLISAPTCYTSPLAYHQLVSRRSPTFKHVSLRHPNEVRENGPLPLFCTWETISRVMHPIWGSTVLEMWIYWSRAKAAESLQGVRRAGTQDVWEYLERHAFVLPGEDKIKGC